MMNGLDVPNQPEPNQPEPNQTEPNRTSIDVLVICIIGQNRIFTIFCGVTINSIVANRYCEIIAIKQAMIYFLLNKI